MLSGINKYLVLILVVFFIAILFLLSQTKSIQNPLPTFINNAINAPSLSPSLPTGPTGKPAADLFAQNSKDNPINKLVFEDIKSQLKDTTGYKAEGQFHGKIISITTSDSGLVYLLESYLPNWLHKQLWLTWRKEDLGKITYFSDENRTIKLPAEKIKENDEVYIYENNDYSKDYPESIISVSIVKLNK
ncbi:MAG: hypothetical protein ACMG6E_02780 [Candidatus Roizmanbacteria bacterium]